MKTIILVLGCILMIQSAFGQSRLNDTLVGQLSIISADDQTYRGQLEAIQKSYGWESKEMKAVLKKINEKDSVNQIKITAILDRYGWVGTDIAGISGNETLFLVIQHADQATQEKYLPMMRDAVKNGKAKSSSLALLEDRVALKQGRKQIYGSQISWNMKTNAYYVLPLADPDHVDERRAQMGLPSLRIYLSNWQMKWDVEQYKKDLPQLEAKLKAKTL